jgi:hypothetical protein
MRGDEVRDGLRVHVTGAQGIARCQRLRIFRNRQQNVLSSDPRVPKSLCLAERRPER